MHEREAFLRNRCGCHASVIHGRDDSAPLFRAAARFENLGSSDSAVIDSRYKAAQDRLAEILKAAYAAREELLPESAIHRPASRRRGQRVVNNIHKDSLREIH